jgi:hypothetical protein
MVMCILGSLLGGVPRPAVLTWRSAQTHPAGGHGTGLVYWEHLCTLNKLVKRHLTITNTA